VGALDTSLRNSASPRFDLTPDHQQILDLASDFSKDELLPLQQRMDNDEWWPPQVMPALARMGFLGVTVPESLGGSGSDFFTSGLITQGLARYNPAVALSYAAHEISASTTSPAMRRRNCSAASCRAFATAARSVRWR